MAAGIGLGISMGWAVAKKGFSAVIQGLFAILEARSTYFENANDSKLSVQGLETAGLLDKASIVLTPTGYSEDAIHNVKPSSASFGDMSLVKNSTSTRVNEDGLVVTNAKDIPRIDYSKGSGAILTELSGVNIMKYSEAFNQTGTWVPQSNSNISTITTDDPRGNTTTVFTFEETGPGQFNLGFPGAISHTSGKGLGVSIWVKKVGGIGSTGVFKIGKLYNMSEELETYIVGSEWQRVTWKSTASAFASHMVLRGDAGQVFAIWGAQAESAGYGRPGTVSSYIPTSGSTVQRVRDNYANGGGSALIGQSEGVLYFEGASLVDYQGGRAIALSDGTAANRVVLFFDYAQAKIRTLVKDGSNNQTIFIQPIADQTSFNKIAVKYKSGDIALWINGTERQGGTGTPFAFTSPLTELAFDQGNGSVHMDGFIKQVAVFKEALSDAELTALTT
jgi:hypothetical protein